MALAARFVPSHPARVPQWVPGWRALYGERLRNTVHGVAEPLIVALHRETRLLHMHIHLISSPAMIGHILLDNQANCLRPPVARSIPQPFIGEGLLTAEGATWKLQRRIVAGAFTPAAVSQLTGLMRDAARRLVATWSAHPARIDLAEEATQITMVVIADALFAGDPRLTAREAGAHIARIRAASGQPHPLALVGLGRFDPSPSQVAVRRSALWLRTRIAALVTDHARADAGGFFAGLVRALRGVYPREHADALALDNAPTFFVVGHETTAVGLAWGAYLLAAQPELQEHLRAEALAALARPAEALPGQVPLLRQFLDETMRPYPPVTQITRSALADDRIEGVRVRAGEFVAIYRWVVHRHRALWDDPDAFDLTRFAPEKRAAQHRFQHLPFGAGPRICVGMRFALDEALVILAQYLAARRCRLPDGAAPMPYGSITLRPFGGMLFEVTPLG